MTVTSITDLRRWAADLTGDAYWTNDPLMHAAASCAVADHVRDLAFKAGMNYGDDWAAFLDSLDTDDLQEVADDLAESLGPVHAEPDTGAP